MSVKQMTKPDSGEVLQTRNAIRRSWSDQERRSRQRLAGARQQSLVAALFAKRAAAKATVAGG